MTTFTTEDRQKATQDVEINVEPIPFVGWVQIQALQDKEDTEKMLRSQLYSQDQEIQRLKRKIRELEEND
jgi:hypothetical protein